PDAGRDIAAGARRVFDEELLTEPLGEPLTYDARDDVDRLTSGKSDHHAHRSRGIGLCPRDPRHGGESGRARGQMQKLSAGKFHSITSSARASSVGGTSRPRAFAVLAA